VSSKEEVALNTKLLLTINSIRQKKWLMLRLSEKGITAFLFVAQGVGGIFVGIFLAAYLAGIPSTAVFHSEPAFRIPLLVLGAVLLVIVLSAFVLAVLSEKD
jgi:hypothetical protein